MPQSMLYALANLYSGVSPVINLAATTCTINGVEVSCPAWSGGVIAISWVSSVLIFLLIIAGMWKIFTKANKPGWASIIPVYNIVVLLEIVGKPIWWVLLSFIPFVNFIIMVIVLNRLSKSFGKGLIFTLGMLFLPFIFYPILGFGSSSYMPVGKEGSTV